MRWMEASRGTLRAVRAVLVLAGLGVAVCFLQVVVNLAGRAGNAPILGGVYTAVVAVAGALCLARAARFADERLTWLAVSGALFLSALANASFSLSWFAGWPLATVASFIWIGAYVLAFFALATLVRSRARGVSLAAWLDGTVGAFVVQAFVALAFLRPVETRIAAGNVASAAYLAFPVLDVLLVTLTAAAAAHSRWQLKGWKAIGTGLLLMAVGDSANVANIVRGTLTPVSIPNVLSLAPVLFFAYAAWRPPPKPVASRPWALVPAVFGSAGLVAMLVATLATRNLIAIILAGVALTAVILRFALTLTANERMLESAQADAATDVLTGLPNRRTLIEDLEAACRTATTQRPWMLMLFDLDGFKDYNDTFGHQAGDALLVELSRRLSGSVATFGQVYRMGGDEFCVLAEVTTAAPKAVAGRALTALSQACHGLSIQASAGFMLIPDEARTSGEALRLADQRMYHEKRAGREGSPPAVALALLAAFEGRSGALEVHSAQVAALAASVAEELGIHPDEVERVRLAGALHDIGKAALPDSILAKPGPLDDGEWEFMRRHTLIGARMLENVPSLADIAPLVRSSHERFDGRGYPDGLAGEAILLGARIIFVCDAYDAMTSTRPYQPAIAQAAAVAELRRCAGSQFDPAVVEAFCRVIANRPDELEALVATRAPAAGLSPLA